MTNPKDNVSPKIQFNKNGYEFRTDVLEMAKQFTEFEFSNKWMGWEQTAKRDKETGQVVMDVKMPDVPGTDEFLKNAARFYDFVNGTPDKDNK